MKLLKINEATFPEFDSTEERLITMDIDVLFKDEKHTIIFTLKEVGEFEYSDGDGYLTPNITTLLDSRFEGVAIHLYKGGITIPAFGISEDELIEIVHEYYDIENLTEANRQLAK